MAQEKEIKIKLKKTLLADLIHRIEQKNFVLSKTINQLDIYFDTPEWFLYNNLAALRLRKVDGQDYSFSFKKVFYLPNKKDHYYIEEVEAKFPLKDKKILQEIFKKLQIPFNRAADHFYSGTGITDFLTKQGYFDEQKMPKVRRVYKKDDNEMVIDDVDKVGIIIELECLKDEPLELVKDILNDSEWERDLEGTSYAWLRIVKGLNSNSDNLNKFINEPEWNVWEHEKEFYKQISL